MKEPYSLNGTDKSIDELAKVPHHLCVCQWSYARVYTLR